MKVGQDRAQKGADRREIADLSRAVPMGIAVLRGSVLQKVADSKEIVGRRADARRNDDLREIAVQKADALKGIVGLMRVVPRRVARKVVAPTVIADQMARAVR